MADGMGYIVAAYVVTWVGLAGYAVRLVGVSRRAREQFERASRDAGGSA
jgi:CcmD family protein